MGQAAAEWGLLLSFTPADSMGSPASAHRQFPTWKDSGPFFTWGISREQPDLFSAWQMSQVLTRQHRQMGESVYTDLDKGNFQHILPLSPMLWYLLAASTPVLLAEQLWSLANPEPANT